MVLPPSRSKKVKRRGTRPSADQSYPKLEWVGYEIDTAANLMRFMRQLAKDGYTSKLGPRQLGALNTAAKNLVDVYGMADHRLVELEARIAKLEQALGAGSTNRPSRTATGSAAPSEEEAN